MAPEQFSGIANEGTDQFSFCLTLYEALYGHYPLGTKTPRTLDPKRDISEQILSPLNKGNVPDSLRRILLRGMAVDARDRWPSLRELQYELSHVLTPDRSNLRWAAVAGLTSLVVATAYFVAPNPPPAAVVEDVSSYAAELEELRSELDKLRKVDEELSEKRKRIQALEKIISDRERAIAIDELAKEVALAEDLAKPRKIRPPKPLPVHSVERSITPRLSEVLACYKDALSEDTEIVVKLKVGIAATGIVKWVTPAIGGNRRANQCLEKALTRITLPTADGATNATLVFSFFLLQESGLPAVNMRAQTRHAQLGQVTVDSKGRVLVDCTPTDPLCGFP
jgi:hypothetical protein